MMIRIFSLQEKVVKVSISLTLVFCIFLFLSKTFDPIALLCGGITTLFGIHPFNSKLHSFEFFRLIGVIIGILGALFLFFLFFTLNVSLRYSVYLLAMFAFLLVISTGNFPEKIASNVSVITLVILTLHLDQANVFLFKTLTLRVVLYY